MNKLSLYLKGILIGFCSLAVPGLSASTIAIVLVVYYDMIYAISHILKKPKQSIGFLLVLLGGFLIFLAIYRPAREAVQRKLFI